MRIIDTHCHVDLYPAYEQLLAEIEHQQIRTVAVTNTPSVFRRCAQLCAGRQFVRPALGLHPQLVRERHNELDLFAELVNETRYIGEVGLDFVTRDEHERVLQGKTFERMLELCSGKSKVFTVHSRRAAPEVITAIGSGYPGTIILHWFSGTVSMLEKAVSFGFFFSINSSMVSSPNGLKLIAAMPRERVLTESDGPFVQIDGRPSRPADIAGVVSDLARIWNTDPITAADMVQANFSSALKQHM